MQRLAGELRKSAAVGTHLPSVKHLEFGRILHVVPTPSESTHPNTQTADSVFLSHVSQEQEGQTSFILL